jgi:hypothetical protein
MRDGGTGSGSPKSSLKKDTRAGLAGGEMKCESYN